MVWFPPLLAVCRFHVDDVRMSFTAFRVSWANETRAGEGRIGTRQFHMQDLRSQPKVQRVNASQSTWMSDLTSMAHDLISEPAPLVASYCSWTVGFWIMYRMSVVDVGGRTPKGARMSTSSTHPSRRRAARPSFNTVLLVVFLDGVQQFEMSVWRDNQKKPPKL